MRRIKKIIATCLCTALILGAAPVLAEEIVAVDSTEATIEAASTENPWLQSITVEKDTGSNGTPTWIVKDNVPTGETLGGAISYNPQTKTLTLNNFSGYKALTMVEMGDVNLELIGANSLVDDSTGINAPVGTNVTITGSGSYSFANPRNLIGRAIWATNLTINSGTIKTNGAYISAVDDVTVNGGTLDLFANGEGCIHGNDISINGGTLSLVNVLYPGFPSLIPTLNAPTSYISPTADVTKSSDGNSIVIVDDDVITGDISYRTHVENIGWQEWKNEGNLSGTSGRGLRLEGIELKVADMGTDDVGIRYKTHVQNLGWQDWVYNGNMSGTSGKGLRLEGIDIELTGADAGKYDIYYQVHAENFGWLGWAKNGESSGTAGYWCRLEGIKVVLVEKGAAGPISNSDLEPFYNR